jgi:hypothetical protein
MVKAKGLRFSVLRAALRWRRNGRHCYLGIVHWHMLHRLLVAHRRIGRGLRRGGLMGERQVSLRKLFG